MAARHGAGVTALCLHLGAHKTATTWLQARLAAGLPALRERGLDHEPMEVFRKRFTDPLDRLVNRGMAEEAEPMREAMRGWLSRGARRFIASDENLVGQCNPLVASGRLYGSLPKRLKHLAPLLPEPPETVVITLRAYPDFLAAAYAESLWHDHFVPFDAFRARLRTDDGLWRRVVGDLVAAFGAGRVRVFRYEALREKLPDLLDALCGEPFDPALLPDQPPQREGLSARAIEELHRIAAETGRETTRRAMRGVIARFPRGTEHPGFDPWTEEERARLDALYAEHLAAIARRWPGVMI